LDSSGISTPNNAIDGIVITIEPRYSTVSAARWLCVIAMPSGTPVRIAKPTATLTMETCSSVRSPMTGRLCRMNDQRFHRTPSRRTHTVGRQA
jgi:hypothetical protein